MPLLRALDLKSCLQSHRPVAFVPLSNDFFCNRALFDKTVSGGWGLCQEHSAAVSQLSMLTASADPHEPGS